MKHIHSWNADGYSAGQETPYLLWKFKAYQSPIFRPYPQPLVLYPDITLIYNNYLNAIFLFTTRPLKWPSAVWLKSSTHCPCLLRMLMCYYLNHTESYLCYVQLPKWKYFHFLITISKICRLLCSFGMCSNFLSRFAGKQRFSAF